jgi:hypothetical protein
VTRSRFATRETDKKYQNPKISPSLWLIESRILAKTPLQNGCFKGDFASFHAGF